MRANAPSIAFAKAPSSSTKWALERALPLSLDYSSDTLSTEVDSKCEIQILQPGLHMSDHLTFLANKS